LTTREEEEEEEELRRKKAFRLGHRERVNDDLEVILRDLCWSCIV